MKIYPGTIDVAVTNYLGELIASEEVHTPTSDPKTVASEISAIVAGLATPTARFSGKCLGLGIALPGAVEVDGTIRKSLLGWDAVNFKQLVQQGVGLPVMVDNDVNVLAQGHLLFGQAQGRQNALVVTIGRGFGLGIVVRGAVYRGKNGMAAEIGHIPWTMTADYCTCGRSDCIENTVSDRAALQHYRMRRGESRVVTIETLRERCRQGDPDAVEVFRIMGREAAKAIVSLTDVFAPEVVILSGEGLNAGHALTDAIYGEWSSYGERMPFRPVEWVLDSWDNFHWARSAVSLVFDELIFPGAIKGPVFGP